MPSELFLMQSIGRAVALVVLFVALASCGDSSGGGSSPAPAPPAGSATIAGTVSGTVIKVLRGDTNAVISQTDTASLVNPPFAFTLANIPVGIPIKVFFFSAGQTYPLYVGNLPGTNVFTAQTAGSINLGFVTMNGGIATPQNQPANVRYGSEDLTPLPPGVEPPPTKLTVATPTPAPATGSVIVNFTVQNFVIGGQGQQHLHINVDGGPTRHFFNGQTNNVLDDNGQPTTDVERQSATSFRISGLAPGQHSVAARLTTASDNEFVNEQANPDPVNITINNPPAPPPTLTITSPSQGASLPSGPVYVSFIVQNFMIGGQGAPHLHFYVDGGAANHFFNAPINQVLDGNGQLVANITWLSSTSFEMTALPGGPHTIQLMLADAVDQELQNAEAKPPLLNISIQALPGNATLTINSPAQGASLSPGPVLVAFDIQNSPVSLSTSQPRMHFYVDNDTTVYKFYEGPGVTEEGSSSGVRYQDIHTHFVHWKSGSSIQLNALGAGSHHVRFVLVDQGENELVSTEKTLLFIIQPGTSGEFSLQPVVDNSDSFRLNFPVAMATVPDGRVFVNELLTGKIRVVIPTSVLPWQLQAAPFATLQIETGGEKGLLGIAVDPDFSSNGFVYVYYTAPGPINRIGRFTATISSNGDTVATSATPTVIFNNIPAADTHNGGFIQFGPDGMLYIFVGENEVDPNEAQNLSSLKGKILRITKDGAIPSDNPFSNSAIYSLGLRNSFGFTFHPHTGDLWQTENGGNDDDEINRITRGGNYGWPIVSGIGNNPPYIDPIITFTPTIAPTGIVAIREDSAYPVQYHNNLLFADFNIGRLHRIVLGGPELTNFVSHSIACDCGWFGLLSVMHGLNVSGQDGYIYVSNGGDLIFRVVLNSP